MNEGASSRRLLLPGPFLGGRPALLTGRVWLRGLLGGCRGETGAHTGQARGSGLLRCTTVVQKEEGRTLGFGLVLGRNTVASQNKQTNKQTNQKKRSRSLAQGCFPNYDSEVPVWVEKPG